MSLCPLTDLTLPWCRSIFGARSPSTGLEDKRNAVGRMSVLTPCSVVILKDLPCRCCEVSSQATNSILFCWLFTATDRCEKSCVKVCVICF